MQGRNNQYECGLEISDAQAEDHGDWICLIESYVKDGQRDIDDTLYTHVDAASPKPDNIFICVAENVPSNG